MNNHVGRVPQSNNPFAQGDEEAARRYEKYKSKDPFPAIPPALLNSADICKYVAITGMVFPFNPTPEKLKPASYEIDLLGEIHLWDQKGKRQVHSLREGKRFPLIQNSIVFVFLETKFRLPDYIALRFNLRITHAHRGLLLGTGPLVDPGFEGRLLIPLHNLTSEDYELEVGEGLIWVEFTKLSSNERWLQKKGTTGHSFEYNPFPGDKKNKTPEIYFERASHGNPIRSSIPDVIQGAQRSADKAEQEARRISKTITWAGCISIFVMLISLILGLYQIVSLVQDSNEYMHNARKDLVKFEKEFDQQKQIIEELETEIQNLKEKLEKSNNQL